jgi:restriction system protein
MTLDFFTGRQQELQNLSDFVFNWKAPNILNINGSRGVGKTALLYAFLEINKDRLRNDFSLYQDSFLGFRDFENDKKKLILIDNFRGGYAEIVQLKAFSDNNPTKKIILISELIENTFFIDDRLSLRGRIHNLKLNGFSRQEIYDLIQKRVNYANLNYQVETIIRNLKLSNNKGDYTNPKIILSTINYLLENNLIDSDFNSIIKDSFTASPIVDQFGNPLSTDSLNGIQMADSIKVVNNTLLDKVYRKPEDIYKLSSREFEYLVAELFEKDGYTVKITKATHDGGKDLMIAEKSSLGSFMFYVECKKYSPTNHIGVSLLRELYGTVQADNATAGIFVTSSYFSKEARDFQEKIKYQLSLKDYYDLIDWIKNYGVQYAV